MLCLLYFCKNLLVGDIVGHVFVVPMNVCPFFLPHFLALIAFGRSGFAAVDIQLQVN